MPGLTFSSKLDQGFYIISIAKTAFKKIGALIRPLNVFALYLYKSVIRPCMEYCCHKNVYVNSFFPRTASIWNSLPMECFPLTYDLKGFKSRIKRHLLTLGSF